MQLASVDLGTRPPSQIRLASSCTHTLSQLPSCGPSLGQQRAPPLTSKLASFQVGTEVVRSSIAVAAAPRSDNAETALPTAPQASGENLSGGSLASQMSQQTLQGIWIKDEKASDMKAYERSLTYCMRMGGLEKETAQRLFEGMQLTQTGDTFSVRYLTVVPFFQVTESFSFSQKTSMKRRDGRPGQQTAQPALQLPGGVGIVLDWGGPLAGHLEDLFTLEGPDGKTLRVRSKLNVEGRTNETLQVFRWAERWKPRFNWPFGGSV